ncbi:MAG: hypothetical protein MZV70_76900 [Desulfobacterales bacterium]|nr:hypothetical protein [Desulfobacterales bacterium]
MANIMEMFHKTSAKLAEFNFSKSADYLRYTAGFTFAFSSLSQALAFSVNKKIPEKEKHFLVSQEVAEGAINVGIFMSFATFFQNFGSKVVEKCWVLPNTLPEQLRTTEHVKNLLDAQKKSEKQKPANLTGIIDEFKLQNLATPENLTSYAKDLEKVQGLMKVGTMMLGSIIALNIVTPLIRNKIASHYQQKKIGGNTTTPMENTNFAMKNANFAMKNNNVYKDLIKNYYISNSSSMRI